MKAFPNLSTPFVEDAPETNTSSNGTSKLNRPPHPVLAPWLDHGLFSSQRNKNEKQSKRNTQNWIPLTEKGA